MRGIFSTASGGLEDGLCESWALEQTTESVAQVGIGTHAELLGSLHQCGEDVHCTDSSFAATVQADVAAARTHAGT